MRKEQHIKQTRFNSRGHQCHLQRVSCILESVMESLCYDGIPVVTQHAISLTACCNKRNIKTGRLQSDSLQSSPQNIYLSCVVLICDIKVNANTSIHLRIKTSRSSCACANTSPGREGRGKGGGGGGGEALLE